MVDYAEIKLDKVRRLKYRWGDIRELSRRLGEGDGKRLTLRGLLSKLEEAEPETITIMVAVGLRAEDDKLTIDQVDEMLDAYFKRDDGTLATLLAAINAAIQGQGALRDRGKKAPAAVDPSQPAS